MELIDKRLRFLYEKLTSCKKKRRNAVEISIYQGQIYVLKAIEKDLKELFVKIRDLVLVDSRSGLSLLKHIDELIGEKNGSKSKKMWR